MVLGRHPLFPGCLSSSITSSTPYAGRMWPSTVRETRRPTAFDAPLQAARRRFRCVGIGGVSNEAGVEKAKPRNPP